MKIKQLTNDFLIIFSSLFPLSLLAFSWLGIGHYLQKELEHVVQSGLGVQL